MRILFVTIIAVLCAVFVVSSLAWADIAPPPPKPKPPPPKDPPVQGSILGVASLELFGAAAGVLIALEAAFLIGLAVTRRKHGGK